ncbi:MAG: formate dehydrogenase subunit alpha [Chloroflexi bacterium]|nr:formate dehydrogenase subunit alpha [Chloroflexota bacterium]
MCAEEMIPLTVDGKPVEVGRGSTILDAANKLGIYIPQLCKDPRQRPLGACRTCLVQIEGRSGFPPSCATLARPGMVVHTDTPEVVRLRRGIIELTLAMHEAKPHEKYGQRECELEVAARTHQADPLRFKRILRTSLDDSNPFWVIDMDLCILCGRCIVACQDVQHIGAIAFIHRGFDTKVGTFGDDPLIKSVSTNCGQCVSSCPTGAIRPKKQHGIVTKEVSTICPYCGVGCGLNLQVDEKHQVIVNSLDSPQNPSSQGMLCVKGRFGFEYVYHPERLKTPLIKRDGKFEPATWEEALDLVATRFVEYRGQFVAFGSAKATNEDNYVLQKFVRGVMGTNNIDHCQRLCHSSSVEAMMAGTGGGSTTNSYADYERAGCLMIVGSDPSQNHPVIDARLRRVLDGGEAKIIVVNPKFVVDCYYADLWLQNRPGTDIALFNGLARIILDEDLWDRDFVSARTENFEMWRASLTSYTPDRVSSITGVPVEHLRQAARWYAQPPRPGSCILWGMGISQHTTGVKNAHALVNLALLTGQIGKPGSGLSPLRGQNNVQGCSDVGAVPAFLPGYQPISGGGVDQFAQAWELPLSEVRGLAQTEMIEGMLHGEVKCAYLVGENPSLTEPNLSHAREALALLKFHVSQDIFLTETAALADVVLPATSFAEKDGTFTNSERRVQRVRKAIEPVGESRPDWDIVCDIARRVGRKLGIVTDQFDYSHPSEIFAEMSGLMPQYRGITYERLEESGLQWPCPTADSPGTALLFTNEFIRGRGRFEVTEQGVPAAELPGPGFPLILNTGRVLYHWHGGTMTKKVEGLLAMVPELIVSVNPADAESRGIRTDDRILLRSRRGEIRAKALVTDHVQPGEVFTTFVAFDGNEANFLTNAAYDPQSRIPEYKVCAVELSKA